MAITATALTRTAGLSAVAAGILFIGIQINHPPLDAEFATTTEYTVRQSLKALMAVLSFIGITGMYLRQVKEAGVLGLVGYLVFGAGYLIMMCAEVIGAAVLPIIARSDPGYVNDIFATVTGGQVSGDIGLMQALLIANAITFLGGGLLFGLGLFRARVLARWAAVLLAAGSVATLGIPLLPQINERLFALPIGIAMIGLGYSLWRSLRSPAVAPRAGVDGSPLHPAGSK